MTSSQARSVSTTPSQGASGTQVTSAAVEITQSSSTRRQAGTLNHLTHVRPPVEDGARGLPTLRMRVAAVGTKPRRKGVLYERHDDVAVGTVQPAIQTASPAGNSVALSDIADELMSSSSAPIEGSPHDTSPPPDTTAGNAAGRSGRSSRKRRLSTVPLEVDDAHTQAPTSARDAVRRGNNSSPLQSSTTTMHYKYASSEAPAPRRLWYKEFTPELQQTATLVADDVPLGEAAEAVDELQQKYNCTLIFKASSNERPPVDVQAHLSPKGRALTDLKESGVCAGKHHLAKGSFSSVDLIRRLGKGNCGKSQYLLLSRLVCNAISRACTTSGPHMCTFEVHVFVERPLVEDGAQRKHYQRQLARGLVGPDYEYQRTAFAKCTIVMYGKHSPGSTYTSSLASAGYAARAVVDEALHGGVIGAGRVHARPMDVHTMMVESQQNAVEHADKLLNNTSSSTRQREAAQRILVAAQHPVFISTLAKTQRRKKYLLMKQSARLTALESNADASKLASVRAKLEEDGQLTLWRDPNVNRVSGQAVLESDDTVDSTALSRQQLFWIIGVRMKSRHFELMCRQMCDRGIYVDGCGKMSMVRATELGFYVKPVISNPRKNGERMETKAVMAAAYVVSKVTIPVWKAVIQSFKKEFTNALANENATPAFVMMDKDAECREALQTLWPGVPLYLCDWHEGKALMEWLNKNRFKNQVLGKQCLLYAFRRMKRASSQAEFEDFEQKFTVEALQVEFPTLQTLGEETKEFVNYIKKEWLCEAWRRSWPSYVRKGSAHNTNIVAENGWRQEQTFEYQNRLRRSLEQQLLTCTAMMSRQALQLLGWEAHGFDPAPKTREERMEEKNMRTGMLFSRLLNFEMRQGSDSFGHETAEYVLWEKTTSSKEATVVRRQLEDVEGSDVVRYSCSCSFWVVHGHICPHIAAVRVQNREQAEIRLTRNDLGIVHGELVSHRTQSLPEWGSLISFQHQLMTHEIGHRHVHESLHPNGKRGPKKQKVFEWFPFVRFNVDHRALPDDVRNLLFGTGKADVFGVFHGFLGGEIVVDILEVQGSEERHIARTVIKHSAVDVRHTVTSNTRDLNRFVETLLEEYASRSVQTSDDEVTATREERDIPCDTSMMCKTILEYGLTAQHRNAPLKAPHYQATRDGHTFKNTCALLTPLWLLTCIIGSDLTLMEMVTSSERQGDSMLTAMMRKFAAGDVYTVCKNWYGDIGAQDPATTFSREVQQVCQRATSDMIFCESDEVFFSLLMAKRCVLFNPRESVDVSTGAGNGTSVGKFEDFETFADDWVTATQQHGFTHIITREKCARVIDAYTKSALSCAVDLDPDALLFSVGTSPLTQKVREHLQQHILREAARDVNNLHEADRLREQRLGGISHRDVPQRIILDNGKQAELAGVILNGCQSIEAHYVGFVLITDNTVCDCGVAAGWYFYDSAKTDLHMRMHAVGSLEEYGRDDADFVPADAIDVEAYDVCTLLYRQVQPSNGHGSAADNHSLNEQSSMAEDAIHDNE